MTPEQKKEFDLIIKRKIWPFFEDVLKSYNESINLRITARKGRVVGFQVQKDEPNTFGG